MISGIKTGEIQGAKIGLRLTVKRGVFATRENH